MTIVSGEGTQRAEIHVPELTEENPDTATETTRVWAKMKIKVWARGTAEGESRCVTFIEEWDPHTRSQLGCGSDMNGDGEPDCRYVVEW